MARQGCAVMSQTAGESLTATAPENGGSWLLIEHPGPWHSANPYLILPKDVQDLIAMALSLHVRPQLIRRPGRRVLLQEHNVFVASNRVGVPWLEHRLLTDLTGLTSLNLIDVAAGKPPKFGTACREPLLLVCTHGRRDACCAEFGRPAAVAMTAKYPTAVWETTHLNGDRFAGNVACVPASTYHGRVTVETALAVADACLRNEVFLPHYRGRAGRSAVAQAAEYAVRISTNEYGCNDIQIDAIRQDGPQWIVRLAVKSRVFDVWVQQESAGQPRPATCADCPFETPVNHIVTDIAELTPVTA